MDPREFKELEDAMAESQKATEIASMWERHRAANPGRRIHFRHWLDRTFGNGKVHEMRQQLYNRGSWVRPLWDAIDNDGMTVNTALRLVRNAEKMEGSVPENLRKILDEYNSDECVVHKTKDGRVIRRKKAGPRKPKFRTEDVDVSHTLRDGKDLWATLLELGEEYVTARAPDLEDFERKQLSNQFTRGLRVVFEDFTRDVNNARRRNRGHRVKSVSKRSIRIACNILGVPYRDGVLPDMTLANRRYKTLAARMHPDSNNGSEEMLKQYHAINEAWQILKEAANAG